MPTENSFPRLLLTQQARWLKVSFFSKFEVSQVQIENTIESSSISKDKHRDLLFRFFHLKKFKTRTRWFSDGGSKNGVGGAILSN